MRYSSLFRSRWLALLWSVGIIWSALSFTGWQEEGGEAITANSGDDGADINQLEALVTKLKSS